MPSNMMKTLKFERERARASSSTELTGSPRADFSVDVLVFRSWEAEAKDGMVVLSETGECYGG